MVIPEYTSLEEKGYDLNRKDVPHPFVDYQCIVDADMFDMWYNVNIDQKNRFFRGIKEAKYKNFTSAQRLYFTNDYPNASPLDLVKAHIDEMRKVQNGILPAFCESMNIPCTDLFLLSCSQHHKNGISPLLDFTSDLNTALFFMCKDAKAPINGIGTDREPDINNFVSIYTANLFSKQISLQFLCDALVKGIKKDAEKVLGEKNVSLSEILKMKQYQQGMADILKEHILSFFTYPKIRAVLYEATEYNPILIENKPLKIKVEDYEAETKLTISNLNMVAQHGCFLYHDKGITPLEENLACVDVHKSLIPYIVNKYLKPNNICEASLFPTEDNIVNESTFNTMASIVKNQDNED